MAAVLRGEPLREGGAGFLQLLRVCHAICTNEVSINFMPGKGKTGQGRAGQGRADRAGRFRAEQGRVGWDGARAGTAMQACHDQVYTVMHMQSWKCTPCE